MAQVHVQGLPEAVEASRLAVLAAVAEAGVSLDFLKLTSSGMAFLIAGGLAERTKAAIEPLAPSVTVYEGRSIVMVHAANMRDEEGLIARIVSVAIASGGAIDHLGDMHDRLLIAAPAADADVIAQAIRARLMEAGP
jgi:aspartokinase